ncbi:uncharacterized protein LOC130053666 [Ostrea edulis]|uniref:uncharacterized protein LOC130053666 n=1 Tax=Ostrea edulis TaxID=37623 RepID=UPI0024AF539F|nr:uncharacterized protein LOC130053666 [Ostrea edulis]
MTKVRKYCRVGSGSSKHVYCDDGLYPSLVYRLQMDILIHKTIEVWGVQRAASWICGKDKVSFYRLPAVISNQGEKNTGIVRKKTEIVDFQDQQSRPATFIVPIYTSVFGTFCECQGYGGRTSDKFVINDSGFLEKLQYGDIVLADRGFDIAESVAQASSEVMIPAFTKGKSQLSAVDIEKTRKLAHVRIHVESVIGLVRNKYVILQDTLPLDYLISSDGSIPTIDKIVTVCCALTNMCKSVVPFD